MKQEQKETSLGEASISSLIAKFALPAILSNLVGSLYNGSLTVEWKESILQVA